MKDLVSIIVPIYNVENYLNKCLISLTSQTYQKIEIILVDDGSTDQSSRICEKWAAKDKRIKVIHQMNGGLSDARNRGIQEAHGKLLTFVDSDDYVHTRMIEILYANLRHQNADLSIGRVATVTEQRKKRKATAPLKNSVSVYTKQEALEQLLGKQSIAFVTAYSKLYKKEFFEHIRYPKGRRNEDVFTTYKLIYQADKIVYTEYPVYFYLQRQGSIMHQGFSIKQMDAFDGYEEMLIFLLEHKERALASKAACNLLFGILSLICKIRLEKDSQYNEILDRLEHRYRQNIKKYDCLINHKLFYYGFLFCEFPYIAVKYAYEWLKRKRNQKLLE